MGPGDGGERDRRFVRRRRRPWLLGLRSVVGRRRLGRSSSADALRRSPSAGASAESPSASPRRRRGLVGSPSLLGGGFGRLGESSARSVLGRRLRPASAAASSATGFLGGELPRRPASSAASFLGDRLSAGSLFGQQLPRPAASSATSFLGGRASSAAASSATGSSAGAAAAASAASAAAAALASRSSTRSLAFSPGSPFFGLLRAGALADAGGVEEAQHAVRRLGADRQPMRDALGVELHALGRILGQQRVVGADLLDEAAVARRRGCRRRRCGNKGRFLAPPRARRIATAIFYFLLVNCVISL